MVVVMVRASGVLTGWAPRHCAAKLFLQRLDKRAQSRGFPMNGLLCLLMSDVRRNCRLPCPIEWRP